MGPHHSHLNYGGYGGYRRRCGYGCGCSACTYATYNSCNTCCAPAACSPCVTYTNDCCNLQPCGVYSSGCCDTVVGGGVYYTGSSCCN